MAALSSSEALFRAVKQEDLNTLKTLIEKGVDLNVRNSLGLTPQEYANVLGKHDVVSLLQAQPRDAIAEAFQAVESQDLRTLRRLIVKEGVDVDAKNPAGLTLSEFARDHDLERAWVWLRKNGGGLPLYTESREYKEMIQTQLESKRNEEKQRREEEWRANTAAWEAFKAQNCPPRHPSELEGKTFFQGANDGIMGGGAGDWGKTITFKADNECDVSTYFYCYHEMVGRDLSARGTMRWQEEDGRLSFEVMTSEGDSLRAFSARLDCFVLVPDPKFGDRPEEFKLKFYLRDPEMGG